jgi:hypothetical protein
VNDETLRQRIQYLMQHGGVYPDPPAKWRMWAIAIVALEVVHVALEIIK